MTVPARLSIVTLGVADLSRSVAFYEAEVAAALDAAVAAGGHHPQAGDHHGSGRTSGSFADPDGHPWEVTYNPGFAIDGDGWARIP